MDAVRSGWEEQVESHIRLMFPSLKVITNDRTIVPSRTTHKKMEVDIFLPEIRLGIELNGEPYHDHHQYDRDLRNGTEISDEMYKERYCEKKGIKLLNIWSSDGDEWVATIDDTIEQRIADESIVPYAAGKTRVLVAAVGYICFAIALLLLPTIFLAAGDILRFLAGNEVELREVVTFVVLGAVSMGSLAIALRLRW